MMVMSRIMTSNEIWIAGYIPSIIFSDKIRKIQTMINKENCVYSFVGQGRGTFNGFPAGG